METEKLIEKFKVEMRNLGVHYFAPVHPFQFRVEMGAVGNRGGHVYANFLNDIKTEEQLEDFIKSIQTELKEMEKVRKQIEEDPSHYWATMSNFC